MREYRHRASVVRLQPPIERLRERRLEFAAVNDNRKRSRWGAIESSIVVGLNVGALVVAVGLLVVAVASVLP